MSREAPAVEAAYKIMRSSRPGNSVRIFRERLASYMDTSQGSNIIRYSKWGAFGCALGVSIAAVCEYSIGGYDPNFMRIMAGGGILVGMYSGFNDRS